MYLVKAQSPLLKNGKTSQHLIKVESDRTQRRWKENESVEQRNIQARIEQEKVAAMLENVAQTARTIDYRMLDELNSPDSDQAHLFKAYLLSLEHLAHHWQLVNPKKYSHRLLNYEHLDLYINELPRSTSDSKLFCVKTFVLSCKTPYMKLKDGAKIFISKEYSNAAGKLHLSFYTLYDLVSRELTPKIDQITADNASLNNSRVSIMAFFKTIFQTDQHQLFEAQMHPLFRENEKPFLKKLRRQLKLFELCVRNFECTYIAMIKELQEKTFKMNLDQNQERSIIMQKREVVPTSKKGQATKVLDNQMFDGDGNILLSNTSTNQSVVLNKMLLQTYGLGTSLYKTNRNGPHAHISPMANFRKGEENSIKPTCSSQGPSLKANPNISPASNHQPASRNFSAGFRPLYSEQGVKQEMVGSIVSNSTGGSNMINGHPFMQSVNSAQRKIITPQIIKHNYIPIQNNHPSTVSSHNQNQLKQMHLSSLTSQKSNQLFSSSDKRAAPEPFLMIPELVSNDEELLVKFVDQMDSSSKQDQKEMFSKSNGLQASINNFQFQTPNNNYYSTLGKFKLMHTLTSGNTPNLQNNLGMMSTMVGTNATNMMNPHMLLMPELTSSDSQQIPFIDPNHHQLGSWADNRAIYKQSVENGSRKLSRNRLNFERDEQVFMMPEGGGSERASGLTFQRGNTQNQNSLQNTARSKDEMIKHSVGGGDQAHQRITTIQHSAQRSLGSISSARNNGGQQQENFGCWQLPPSLPASNLQHMSGEQHLKQQALQENSFDCSSDEDECCFDESNILPASKLMATDCDERHNEVSTSLIASRLTGGASRIEQRVQQVNQDELNAYRRMIEQFNQ